jgi:hypothetical protein
MRALICGCVLLVCAGISNAQIQLVGSTLADGGSTVLVGHFTIPNQPLSDIASVDANGNVICLSNEGGGAFVAANLSATGLALPLATATVLNFGTVSNPADDQAYAAEADQVAQISFSNCRATVAGFMATPGVVSISLGSGLVVAVSPNATYINGTAQTPGANFVVSGAFPTPFEFATITAAAGNLATLALGSPSNTSNSAALSGETFLGIVFLPTSIVSVSATDSEIFLDTLTVAADGEPVIAPLTNFNVSATVSAIAAVSGNFLQIPNSGNIQIAVATSQNQIQFLDFDGSTWSLDPQVLTVPGQITAIAKGSILPEDDLIVQQPNGNAIIFASAALAAPVLSATLTPGQMSFGDWTVNTTSQSQSFTITNSGGGVLAPSLTLAGPNAAMFVLSANCSTLAVGASCEGTLAFDPTQPGNASASLLVSIGGSAAPLSLQLTGNGVAPPSPSVAITPGQISGAAGQTFTFNLTTENISSPAFSVTACVIPKGSCTLSGATLTVATTAASTSFVPSYRPTLPVLILLAGIGLVIRPRRRKLALALCGLVFLTACGQTTHLAPVSDPPPAPAPVSVPGTPTGSYTITVGATSGNTAVSANAVVTIQ